MISNARYRHYEYLYETYLRANCFRIATILRTLPKDSVLRSFGTPLHAEQTCDVLRSLVRARTVYEILSTVAQIAILSPERRNMGRLKSNALSYTLVLQVSAETADDRCDDNFIVTIGGTSAATASLTVFVLRART